MRPPGQDGVEGSGGDQPVETSGEAAPETRRAMPSPTWFKVGLALACLVGLAVRLAFVLIRQRHASIAGGDAYWYHFQAKLLADGKGFLNPFDYFMHGRSTPGADHPPGMTLILAAGNLLGITSPQGQRILLSLIGVGSIAVIGLVGRRVASPRAGVVAAFVAALYPNIWINDGMIMAETPFILAIAGSLLFTYRVWELPRRLDVAALSACLTLAAMTRPESVVLFPVLILPLVLHRTQLAWRERILQVGLAALVPIIAFGPWVGYNLSRYSEPVYLSTGAGQTFVVGNCDLTYSGDFLGYWNRFCLLPPYNDPPAETDPSKRDLAYRNLATDYVKAHKGEVPKVVAARVARLWHVYQVRQSLTLDGYIEGRAGGSAGSGLWTVRSALWGYYLLLPFAVGGVIALRRRRVPIYPLLIQAGMATFVAMLTFGITRYRAGADVAIVIAAAVAIDAIASKWWPSRPWCPRADATDPAGDTEASAATTPGDT